MFRFNLTVFALLLLSHAAFAQNLPAFRWIKEVDGSGSDSFAGLGVDALGNTYVAGSTSSATFPVKAATQNHLASAGLYRIDGPGSAYAALGLTNAAAIAVDPLNPNVLYVDSGGAVVKSTDGGATLSTLTLPSSEVETLAINPVNDQIIYAGTFDKGTFKSSDGGATWSAANGSLTAPAGEFRTDGVWVDPSMPSVVLASVAGNLVRSADGGSTWQVVYPGVDAISLTFDTANPGTLYAVTVGNSLALKSTDHGQTFTTLPEPVALGVILADPNHPGRLLGTGPGGIFESDDGGATWTMKLNLGLDAVNYLMVPDWANGFLYTAIQPSEIVRVTTDLQTITMLGPPAVGAVHGIAVANGHVYVAVAGTRDVYVTKLDASGNVVYSTYFGGSSDDVANAMTVDPAGHVYVTGTTMSLDFPVTKGVYAFSGTSFLFQLNPDGSVGYSTYFTGVTPVAVAVDAAGSAYLAGYSSGNLPVTGGAYQTQCNCAPVSTGFLEIIYTSGFVTKFDPTASALVYSTYIAGPVSFESAVNTLALAADGTAYVAGANGIFHLNATGSALLASHAPSAPIGVPSAMAVAQDGSLYIAGSPWTGSNPFQPTAGAFQTTYSGAPALSGQVGPLPITAIARMDSALAVVKEATYFGGPYDQIDAMTLDSSGNVYVGGTTAPQGLPARTPLQGGFGSTTGFLSELSGDLSTLLFSSYFGDTENFGVRGVGTDSDGTVRLGGVTGLANSESSGPANIYVNSVAISANGVAPPPALRIDAVENAASLVDGAISAGETIVVQGAGFGSGAQLMLGGAVIPAISVTSTAITAAVPQNISGLIYGIGVDVQVQSAGANSNQVLIPVGVTSPGIFSQSGSGSGQGYILNKDGTLNTPANPAAPNDPITIFATGVGPVSFTQGYAVTQYPVNVFIDGFYADGVAAVMGPVAGLPGSVYQITVNVPNPAALVAANPNLKNFVYPPLVGVVMQIDGVSSQGGLALSIAQ